MFSENDLWNKMSDEEKTAYINDEDVWGEDNWFSWYPVRVNGKFVWLKTVIRNRILVHCTGTVLTTYR
jgi:hypothetical protein